MLPIELYTFELGFQALTFALQRSAISIENSVPNIRTPAECHVYRIKAPVKVRYPERHYEMNVQNRTIFEGDKHTLYGKQEGYCNGCKGHFPFRNVTIDHIVPKSKGGTDHEENLQLLCGACNSTKGNGTQAELSARLKKTKGVITDN